MGQRVQHKPCSPVELVPPGKHPLAPRWGRNRGRAGEQGDAGA